LHGKLSRHTGRAKNQRGFARRKFCAVCQCQPCGDAGIGKRSGGQIVQRIGQRKTKCARSNSNFSHRAEWFSCAAEKYACAVFQISYTVHAAHHRQFTRTCVVSSCGLLPFNIFQRCRANAHQRFFRTGNRIGKFRKSRRFAQLVQHSSFHRAYSFVK
jgi:hypothetical protein